jgi:pSer/pThr/pTyr-binding forkhead associated (FHA) protein
MSFHLIYQSVDDAPKRIAISAQQPSVVVGRHEDCDVSFTARAVSRRHCEFRFRDDAVYVKDLGSTVGTLLNGRKVEESRIGPGDIVIVGTYAIRLEEEDEVIPTSGWVLAYQTGEGPKQLGFPHGCDSLLVGRRKDVDILVADPTVGRHHARISWVEDRVVVTDLKSSNGTFVNDVRIKEQALVPGDTLRFGSFPVELICEPPPEGLTEQEWEDRYSVDVEGDDAAPPIWYVLYAESDGRLSVLTLGTERRKIAIGSDTACELRSVRDGIEPDHAEVTWDQGSLVINDLETEQGSEVNGRPVAEHYLRNFDVIWCGQQRIRAIRGSSGSTFGTSNRSHDASKWAPLFKRNERALCVTYTLEEPERVELTLWGDGEMRVETLVDGERRGVDGRADESLFFVFCDVLLRSGFPYLPTEQIDADERPPEVAVFYGEEMDEGVYISQRVQDRVPPYKELLFLIQAVIAELLDE